MADFKVDACGSCGAEVVWAVTLNARTMPVDVEPVEGGNVQLEHRGAGATPLARVLAPAQQFGKAALRRSHFATCPQADRWRHKSTGRRSG